jgi:hypothetical protein
MHTRPNPQFGLMDSLMTIPANDFLDRLAQLVNWATPGARPARAVSGHHGPSAASAAGALHDEPAPALL